MISFTLLALASLSFADDTVAPPPPAESAPVTPPDPMPPVPVAAPAPPPAPLAPAEPVAMVPLDPPTDPRAAVDVHIGVQGGPSSSFAPDGVRRTIGLSARCFFTRAIGIDIALTHSLDGGSRYSYNYSEESDYYYEDGLSVSTTLATERLDLGIRAEAPLLSWFHPYAKVAAVGALSVARLDEDVNDPENLTQLTQVGFNGGGYFAGGLAFPIHVKNQVHIVPSLELGYSALTPIGLGDIGSLAQSGVTFRFASGVAF